jgi:DNA gyrase subunit A
VIDILAVADDDEVLMVTGGGKIQRVRASDISQVGRNTQGVRIIRLDEDDTLVSIARIPANLVDEAELTPPVTEPTAPESLAEESETKPAETEPAESPDEDSTE